MAGVPQKTLSWLYDVLKREYRDPNRTYSDVAHVLARNPGFAPRTDVYTFENGASALLLHFTGTIPVNFRGNTYRFPITLWVPQTYPHESPIFYVSPTPDMVVRPGQYVGGDGKIYHPYLAHWRDAWERSNILDFLSILSDVFAKEPPVMSTGQQQQRPVQPTPPPVPPLPREIQHPPASMPVSSPPPPQQTGPAAPPPPPKQHPQGIASPPPPAQNAGRYEAPPPRPSQINDQGGRPQPPYGSNIIHSPASGMNYMPQRMSSLRQSMPPSQQQKSSRDPEHYRPQPPRPGAEYSYPGSQGPYQPPPQGYETTRQPSSQYQQIPAAQAHTHRPPSQHFPPGQAPPPLQQRNPQAIHPHQQPQKSPAAPPPPPNLLDSPFDIALPAAPTATAHTSNIPAPPIPVNPEKEALLSHLSHLLTQSLHSQIAQSTSALPALSSQSVALQSTMHTLSTELANLQTLHSTLTSNLSLLSTSLAKSDKVISSAKSRAAQNDIPSVDEMLVPPNVVARQLYDAACEERGIEAAIMALQEGFVRGRVGADVWSRRTRELAREEFKRRWMERKVAKGMGLDLVAYGS